ncbi:TIGR01906 family membrane protein [Abyssisolibacter fermentans]|uniref:TIGR01906 family membrane protein n=1 Tax=Abyssisolibacter fermentans TaxID=1766203 RepID=UPI00138F0D21|nr:TIGR01906 family membrane protein [Abyssisolibacter fermentans]
MKVLLIIALPVFLLLNAVWIVAFNDLDFYKAKYQEYDIVKATGIHEKELMLVTAQMLNYLVEKQDNIDFKVNIDGNMKTMFNQKEQIHLSDVRQLVKKGLTIRKLLLLVALTSIIYLVKVNKKGILKIIIFSEGWLFLLLITLTIFITLDFNKWFTYFHLILFDNDLWLLDVKTDILINMYPLEFFESLAIKIGLIFALELVLVLMIVAIINFFQEKRELKSIK